MAWIFDKAVLWSGVRARPGAPVPGASLMRPSRLENLRRCGIVVEVPDLDDCGPDVDGPGAPEPAVSFLSSGQQANGEAAGPVSLQKTAKKKSKRGRKPKLKK